MAAQKKQLSLDTNFVFDLAGDKDFAHEFREIFQSKGYALVLPPTAAHELHFIFTHGDSAAERELARTALTHLCPKVDLQNASASAWPKHVAATPRAPQQPMTFSTASKN